MLGILPAWATNLYWTGGPDIDQMIGKNGFSWPVATGMSIMVIGVAAHVCFEKTQGAAAGQKEQNLIGCYEGG
jgi:hypothetical protein